jgi:hypothetical protein
MTYHDGQQVHTGDKCQSGWTGTCRIIGRLDGDALLKNVKTGERFTVYKEDGMNNFDLLDR